MRGRLIIIVLGLVAVAIAYASSSAGDAKEKPSAARDSAPANAVHVSFAYSPEKEKLLLPLVERFNAERHASGGSPVVVDAKNVRSGDAETQIAAGRLQPVLWSPASSFWGRLLNYEADRKLVADRNPSIVQTPLVIAMWKRLADAYGYPDRALGYTQLGELARGGWAAAGLPEFGAFKYVHTNPDFSTAGLSAVSASYYAAVGKREGFTEADVARGRARVRRLERSIVHYGDTTLFISDELRKRGLGYASAGAMEETTLIDFNQRAGDGERLVAIYPEEGTFFSDNPLITMQGDWVSAQEKEAAGVFAAFLKDAVDPELAGRYGFRPADLAEPPAGAVTAANGVDPHQPDRVLSLPEPRVLARIKEVWRADRKPANVMMVFDNSESMGHENKLAQALAGLKGFFREAAPQDRIGLIKFSSEITELVPIAPMRGNRAKLLAAADRILPEGETRVRDATLAGLEAVLAKSDPDAINAVVVLTDGQDTRSNTAGYDVIQRLQQEGRKESGDQVRVFTIAYGSEPNAQELAKYADVTGGKSYTGTTSQIGSVYREISAFF